MTTTQSAAGFNLNFSLAPLVTGPMGALSGAATAATTVLQATPDPLTSFGLSFLGSGAHDHEQRRTQTAAAAGFGFTAPENVVTARRRVDVRVEPTVEESSRSNALMDMAALASEGYGANMAVTTFVAHWQHLTQANASIREVQETLAEQEEKHREPVDPLVAEAVNEIAEVAEVMTAQTKRAMAQEAVTASKPAHDAGLYDDVADRATLPDMLPLTEEAWKTDAQRQLDKLVTAVDKLKAFEAEHPREIAAVKTMLHVAHQMMNDLTLWVGRTLGMSEASLAEVAEGQRNVEAATQQMIEAAAAALGSAAARHGDTPEQQARYGEAATYAAGAAGGVAALAARTRGGAHIAAQLEGKAAASSRVRTVNGRMPVNAEYANSIYPLSRLPKELRAKYPHSVPFTGTGHPDFSRYAIKKVQIEITGKHSIDERFSNLATGLKETPDGYTWHHHHDGRTMMLVPKDLHKEIKHTGGVAVNKRKT